MEIHGWVIVQTVIDFVLMALLLGALWSFRKRPLPRQEYEEVVKRSEAILTEMKQIGLMLEKNLHEKREISRHLLDQLDQGLAKAQASYKKIMDLHQTHEELFAAQQKILPVDDRQRAMQALSAQGLTQDAIARQLNIPLGEVELFLKLHPKPEV
ncbi:MAG: hypothetical protein EHM45_10850 [Desulfobacteraceae bacterium]|nr:MAG: hypothetical protein EHM45_10850 [Desulfobacteraceae bacterium]